MEAVTLIGRSSSHFTRTARIFALELGIAHHFRPLLDLTSLDVDDYAGNPALKIPVLVDAQGSLFGVENICRALRRRSSAAGVILRGELADRSVENGEELTLHAMAAEVSMLMARNEERTVHTKVEASLVNCLRHLDRQIDALLLALPAQRALSFVEVALHCLLTHLAFRQLLDLREYTRLLAFSQAFGLRESARCTEYHFDAG